MTAAPRIDAHHHVWDRQRFHYAWLEGEALAPIRVDRTPADHRAAHAGIELLGTVIVEAHTSTAETRWLLELAHAAAGPTRIVGFLDLFDPALPDVIGELRSQPEGAHLAGVRHQIQAEPVEWLGRADVRTGLRAVAEAGLVFDLVVLPHQLAACAAVVGDVPELTFVLDHLGKPPLAAGDLDDWRRDLAALATHPNVVAKISGLVTEADWDRWTIDDLRPAVDHALATFGPDRLLWGSDWPVCELAASARRWQETSDALLAGLGPPERRAVLIDNAAVTYGFPLDPRTRLPELA